jgi:hypothetical protein
MEVNGKQAPPTLNPPPQGGRKKKGSFFFYPLLKSFVYLQMNSYNQSPILNKLRIYANFK